LVIGKPPFETPAVKTSYKKIRMNSYSFPDHIPLSDAAKNLISKILTLDPSKRPTLDEMLEHPFLNNGGTIPKSLPVSTLVCPPSASYVKQFLPEDCTVKLAVQPQRLVDTAPLDLENNKVQNNQRKNLISTDRGGQRKPQSTEVTQNVERQPSSKGDEAINGFPAGTLNLNMGGTSARPFTAQQTDLKSSQGLKSLRSATNLETNNPQFSSLPSDKPINKNDIYVKKWVDYSSKYGLGYLLSNGATGVFFNDSTKIISKGSKFDYIQRNPNDKAEIVKSHTLSDYPKDLQKKVTLLQHFRSYLEGENNSNEGDDSCQSDIKIYVKKWMKTKHAVMFRLSNKVVQVNFTDKTEIILSSEKKLVTYVNKKGERSQHPLSTALESTNPEMTKRLKYTKEILTHMLGNNQVPAQSQGNQEAQVAEVENRMNF